MIENYLGLYADYKGCAGVHLEKMLNKDDKFTYHVKNVQFYPNVSEKNIYEILNLIDLKKLWYADVFINPLPSLQKIISAQSTKLIQVDANDKIFLTTVLFNDKILTVNEEVAESFLKNLNKYNPLDENVNHRVMALFLSLEAFQFDCWL